MIELIRRDTCSLVLIRRKRLLYWIMLLGLIGFVGTLVIPWVIPFKDKYQRGAYNFGLALLCLLIYLCCLYGGSSLALQGWSP